MRSVWFLRFVAKNNLIFREKIYVFFLQLRNEKKCNSFIFPTHQTKNISWILERNYAPKLMERPQHILVLKDALFTIHVNSNLSIELMSFHSAKNMKDKEDET